MDGDCGSLILSLSGWIQDHLTANATVVVAFSGGRDSHVLLHSLSELRSQYAFTLKAIHISHGLQQASEAWPAHCEALCKAYNVPLQIIRLQLTVPPGESLEDVARKARYKAFAQYVLADEILLTAHHQEDQAETFLLQLLRGAGPQGLAGIAPMKILGAGKLARPLLNISRAEITEYAQNHKLTWVEDPSNENTQYRRNFLRKAIFPKLGELIPGFAACIARSSAHCQSTQSLLEEYIQNDLLLCAENSAHTLNVEILKTYSPLKQQAILRYWLRTQGVLNPSTKKLDVIVEQMLHAKIDATPHVHWSNVEIRRYQNRLYVLPLQLSEKPPLYAQIWHLDRPFIAYDGRVWQAQRVLGKGVQASKIADNKIEVRFRQGGERAKIAGHLHSRPLKKILQEYDIPPWEREKIPLFYSEDELIAVGNLFVCEGWQVKDPSQWGIML